MKRAIGFLALGVAVVVVAFIVLMAAMNPLAGWAIGHFGTELTGAPVETTEVILQPFGGRARITGLEIGRPPGFNARTAYLKELKVDVDPVTIGWNFVLVREISVDALSVTYERADRGGGTNLDAIQRSIEAHMKRAEASRGGDEKPSGRRYVIEKLTIRNVRVTMTTKGLGGQGLSFQLPDVDLRDVGKKQGGVTSSEVAALVTSTVQQKIALKVLSNVDALRRGGLEGAIDALKSLVK